MSLVKTSYKKDDVVVLLKDLSNSMEPLSTADREVLIQQGVHYSEMLPLEEPPSKEYLSLYHKALEIHKKRIAQLIAMMAVKIKHDTTTDKRPVLVSLARAGVPIGILVKRYLNEFLSCDCSHYAISIVRDKGIDANAMNYIYTQEIDSGKSSVSDIFFIDGWTGKGAILSQLEESVKVLQNEDYKWRQLSSRLFVLADPAYITDDCGTHYDFLIPTACLNSTVSGLISRSILNEHINVVDGDFHGAVYHGQQADMDLSNSFLQTVTECFSEPVITGEALSDGVSRENGIDVVKRVCRDFNIADYYKVKPGIGETTRVLLRRVPWAVLINETIDLSDPDLAHIKELCNEKGVIIRRYNLGNYKTCGIIKELSADA